MIYIEPGMYVKMNQRDEGPLPLPLKSGFSADKSYRVLGIYNASETSEAYMILSNDHKQMWFISNRHLQFDHVASPQDAVQEDHVDMSFLKEFMDHRSAHFSEKIANAIWKFSLRHKGAMISLSLLALYLVDKDVLKKFARFGFNNLALNFSSSLLQAPPAPEEPAEDPIALTH